jgi:hypothetical protein
LTDEVLEAIRRRAVTSEGSAFEDVTVGPEHGEVRHAIASGMLADAEAWLRDSARPLVVTRLGRWVIRVADSLDEAEVEGRRVLGALRQLRASVDDVPVLLAEVEALRLELDAERTQGEAREGMCLQTREERDAALYAAKRLCERVLTAVRVSDVGRGGETGE